MVLHRVGICEEPALVSSAVYHEACAVRGDLPIALPGQTEVWPAVHAIHLDNPRH